MFQLLGAGIGLGSQKQLSSVHPVAETEFPSYFFLPAKRLLGARRCTKGGWRTEEKGKERSFEGLEKMWYNESLTSSSLFILSKSNFMGNAISVFSQEENARY